jgi:hypothetical protein
MVTLPGTETTALLLLTETEAALVVALFNDTAQVLAVPLFRVAGEQVSPVNFAGATRLSVTDFVLPDPAVMTAVWSALTCAAVAVKPPEI